MSGGFTLSPALPRQGGGRKRIPSPLAGEGKGEGDLAALLTSILDEPAWSKPVTTTRRIA